MGQVLGHGIRGAFVNFMGGTIVLAVCRIPTMSSWLSAYWNSRQHEQFKWWMLSGMCHGCATVLHSIIVII